ncbi:hypothetical protein B0H13DRAFT_1866901 [Mycena leptocephala]|nr:hypothetical protein B0H13DRAFT_1866901 [Mycena leptocephala]
MSSSASSNSDYFATLPPELEALLPTADSSLGGGSAAADSPALNFWGSDDLPVSSSSPPTVDLAQHEISDSEAQTFLGWQWQKSSTRWVDESVSSEVCHFPEAIKVSERTKVFYVERVTGLPSQFPIQILDSTTNRVCSGGKAVPKKLGQCPTGHRTLEIPDHIDQELFLKGASGEKIVDDEDQENECCKVSSARQGKKALNHVKEGRPFEARVIHLPCLAESFVFIPHEDKHPELARMCIVIPDHRHPHLHPVPPLLKVPHAVAEKYKQCVRKFGLGATVAKVEKVTELYLKALSTKEILGGSTPSLYHPGLVSRDTKTRLINEVKSEPGNQARHENQRVETYIAEQKARSDEDRYIHVSEREGRTAFLGIKHGLINYIHKVRTLDCDTTFKPVAGKTNIYEINGWMPGINKEVTLGRVWMKFHDRQSFQFVWEELISLVKRLTKQRLAFVALHRGGTLLGLNSDMEPAPLLGMADALLPTIDIPSAVEKFEDAVGLVKGNVRICYSHVKRGIPDVSHLPPEDRDRIFNFMYMKSPEDVEEFKIWIRTLPDLNGVLLRWWEHKEMHEWLLPCVIECLSDIEANVWHVMEATTNFGEAQHAANNIQTGIGMGLVESFMQYEALDTRRAAEIEVMIQSGNLHNPRNEVSHRYSNRNARHVHATEKAKQARAEDDNLQAAEKAFADAQAHLKLIRAESKVQWCFLASFLASHNMQGNSSGRVPAPRVRKTPATKSKANGTPKDCRRKSSTTQASSNTSTSANDVTVADETIPASTIGTSERATSPSRKRSGSTSLESDAPPKRLRLGPLKGWGIEREGVNMSAVEYAQKHWSEFRDEYPEMLPAILPDIDDQ